MVFDFPMTVHRRKHGPQGYINYESYKPWLRDEFTFRCAYCLMRELWSYYPQGSFSADHHIAQVVDTSLRTDYDNLIYCCLRCNSNKRQYKVLDPCATIYGQHLRIRSDGIIEGITADGERHIAILQLDTPDITQFRRSLIQNLQTLMKSEDAETIELLDWLLGFPRDLPDLAKLRPPEGNIRPDGIQFSYYRQRDEGTLPTRY